MAEVYVSTVAAITTGTALKTLMELQTASTSRATIASWWVEFNGTTAANAPVLVELVRASAGITGTTVTAVKYKDFAPAAATVVKHTASAEGTPTDVLEAHYVPPTSGLIIQYPLGREPEVPVSGFIKLRVTAASGSVSANVGFVWEE